MMKIRFRRFTVVLLALSLALGLAACKKENKTEDLDFQTSPYYTSEELSLPLETGELVGSCSDRESIWYLTIPGEDMPPVLCRVPMNGGGAETLAEYQPPAADEDTAMGYRGPILGGDGKLWVWEQFLTFAYDLPEDFDPAADSKSPYFTGSTETFRMRQLDPATGKELKTVDITAAMVGLDALTLRGIAVDAQGTVYLAGRTLVTAVDSQGQILYSLEEELADKSDSGSAGGVLALLPDGTPAVLVIQPVRKRVVRLIDRDAHAWSGKQYAVQDGVNEIYSGSGSFLFYYVSNNTLYGVVDGDAVPYRLISWDSAKLSQIGSAVCFSLLEEGRAVVLVCSYATRMDRYASRLQAIQLSPADEPPDDGTVRLVYGVIGDDISLRYRISQFNRNGKYFIELRDYAEGMLGQGEDNPQVYNSAVARMYTDIASGQGPDILGDTLPLEAQGRQGALENLWPWIENDPDLGREAVMEHVLECMETNGELYRICGSFAIDTAVASAEIAGNRTGWTLEEMLAAYGGGMPELYFSGNNDSRLIDVTFARFDKKSMLYNLVSMGLDRYVDWETGACSFDSGDFKSILELCGMGREAEHVEMSYFQEQGFSKVKSEVMEVCQVFPWEGGPSLYARILAHPWDLMVDDVLFGGLAGLTDYEQRLWDAGILYPAFNSYQNAEDVAMRVRMEGLVAVRSTIAEIQFGISNNHPLAADYVIGGADGSTYASFIGFPAERGTGSSFSVYDCAGVSATSEAKEGAWAFIRSLLLPGGNEHWTETSDFPWIQAFPMNRADFESQIQPEVQWCMNTETGEAFLDANGERIERTEYAVGVGSPIVMMAYLMAPTQAQVDRFWELYNAVDHVTGERSDLLDIICEQAEPYFAGDKSLDETVRLIQNRAQLYVNENK